METWFLADPEAMEEFFGNGFRKKALYPLDANIEKLAKKDLYSKLKAATKDSTSGPYGKGRHSFQLLAELDPTRLRNASPWAARFLDELDELLP